MNNAYQGCDDDTYEIWMRFLFDFNYTWDWRRSENEIWKIDNDQNRGKIRRFVLLYVRNETFAYTYVFERKRCLYKNRVLIFEFFMLTFREYNEDLTEEYKI